MNFSPLRIGVCLAILAVLAITDLVQKGRNATRWREYAFLVLCVAVAMVYGIVNDQITCRISWEYFYYGKNLAPILGPDVPPNFAALQWQAVRIGAAATWWAGLIIGAAMLVTNNPSRRGPQLPYARLVARLPTIFAITAVAAAAFGLAGNDYLLNWISPDFQNIAELNLWRPHRFMAVYGIHVGGYVGGALAAVYAVSSIHRQRRAVG
ncbi:MAG: hypothetical protein ABSC42_01530 [Tepidisphaeraceae bacterium]|jgi:hypothetical protein